MRRVSFPSSSLLSSAVTWNASSIEDLEHSVFNGALACAGLGEAGMPLGKVCGSTAIAHGALDLLGETIECSLDKFKAEITGGEDGRENGVDLDWLPDGWQAWRRGWFRG